MKRSRRLGLVVATAILLVGSIGYACPAWAEHMGLDFWNLPALQDDLDTETARDRELARDTEAVLRSVNVRCAVTNDLIEDRITLEEAVAQFLAINQAEPNRVRYLKVIFPASSLEESTCLQVLSFAEARALQSPDRAAIRSNLRRQLEAFHQRRAHS